MSAKRISLTTVLTLLFQVTALAVLSAQVKKYKDKLPEGCGEGEAPIWQDTDPVTGEPMGVWTCGPDVIELQSQADTNANLIAADHERVVANATDIAANSVGIANNTSGISALGGKVSTNRDLIGRLDGRVLDLENTNPNPDPPCFDNFNRYVDCGNGTVTDTVTGLIWLKDANCFGRHTYAEANALAAELDSDSDTCGLDDNSHRGDWRLPTRQEWATTFARAVELGCTYFTAGAPSLTDREGQACFGNDPAFIGVYFGAFWSSSTAAGTVAYYGNLLFGAAEVSHRYNSEDEEEWPIYVWPVRSP